MDSLRTWASIANSRNEVPDVVQSTSYTCGPSVLSSALRYFGKADPGELELSKLLCTKPGIGTTYDRMVEVANELGLRAVLVEGSTVEELRSVIDAGCLPIVALQAWAADSNKPLFGRYRNRWTNAHFSIVIGIDGRRVYFEDPAIVGRAMLPISEFETRWHVMRNGKRTNGLAIYVCANGLELLRKSNA